MNIFVNKYILNYSEKMIEVKKNTVKVKMFSTVKQKLQQHIFHHNLLEIIHSNKIFFVKL